MFASLPASLCVFSSCFRNRAHPICEITSTLIASAPQALSEPLPTSCRISPPRGGSREEQAALRAEVAAVLGPGPVDAVPFEAVKRLERVAAALKETLRMWPPVSAPCCYKTRHFDMSSPSA